VKRSSDADHVRWIDRGWQPAHIGFCPSAKAWRREMRRMGVKGCAYPKRAGCVTSFDDKDGGLSLIVTLNVGRREVTRVEIAGLLCHEATHVWQAVRKNMAEDEPSKEFEAYAMQAIFQSLYQAWLDLCAPDELKARNAKRVKVND
jgi:hypothetical protein